MTFNLLEKYYYIGHITKTFTYKSQILQVTQMKFFEYVGYLIYKDETWLKCDYNCRWGKDFDIEALTSDFKLVYMLLDSSVLESEAKDLEAENQGLFGGCILNFREAKFGTNFYIEQLDCLLLRDREERFPKHFDGYGMKSSRKKTDYVLHAEYMRPQWFRQHVKDKVVLPDSNVTDSVLLTLEILRRPNSGLTLVRVRVELLVLISEGIAYRAQHLEKTILLDKKCSLPLKDSRGEDPEKNSRVCIPKSCFDCKIPLVGPTFCCELVRRTYALRFDFLLNDGRKSILHVTEALNLNIAVAEGPMHLTPLVPVRSSEAKPTKQVMYMNYIDKQPYSKFDPQLIAKKLFKRLRRHGVKYRCHETVAIRSIDFVVSMTTIEFQKPHGLKMSDFSSWIYHTRQELSNFDFGYHYIGMVNNEALVYKAFDLKNAKLASPSLFGAAVLLIEDDLPMMNFPRQHLYSLQSTTLAQERSAEACGQGILSHSCRLGPVSLKIDLTFTRSSELIQDFGDFIVVPGMNLSDIFQVRLVVRHEDAGLPIASFIINRMEVHLLEKVQIIAENEGISPLLPFETTRSLKLMGFNSGMEVIWAQLTACESGCLKEFSVPKKMYDGSIPNIGPTFFTNNHTRLYFLQFLMQIAINEKHNAVVKANHQINVASLPNRNVKNSEVPPSRDTFFYPVLCVDKKAIRQLYWSRHQW